MDGVHFDANSGRLAWTFSGVDLIGVNTLLRCHQAKVNKYREQWKNRTGSLILQNQRTVREWCAQAQYPLRYEAIYLTRHNTPMDEDNLIGAVKVVLDEIVRQTEIPDDRPEYIRHPLVTSERRPLGALYLALMPLEQTLMSQQSLDWIRDAPQPK